MKSQYNQFNQESVCRFVLTLYPWIPNAEVISINVWLSLSGLGRIEC
jgi:hypothetical protein